MAASDPINFSINGTVLAVQPSGISEIQPQIVEYKTLSGRRLIIESAAGPTVEVTWGVQAARGTIFGILQSARSASGSVSISYKNAAGTTTNRTVYMPKVNYDQFLMTNAIEPLTLTFYTL